MSEQTDIAVIGAGPCGIAVGTAARAAGSRATLFDKGPIASSLLSYPYYMTFFSTAVMLEVGGVPFTIPDPKPTRREALAYYRRVVEHWKLDVRQYEEVVAVRKAADGFVLDTTTLAGDRFQVMAGSVVVAIGGFQAPNMLDVPGEDLPKVRHYYKEPFPYYDQDVVVVGGGNSAVESALELYRNGTRVTLVHFAETIDSGVKPWVVPDITNRLKNGEITPRFRTRVQEITPKSVVLVDEGGRMDEIANDFVLAMTGWRAHHGLLRSLDVRIDPDTGIPDHDPATMETNSDGVFIAGVIAAGHNANKIFIENGREHGGRIVAALRARMDASEP